MVALSGSSVSASSVGLEPKNHLGHDHKDGWNAGSRTRVRRSFVVHARIFSKTSNQWHRSPRCRLRISIFFQGYHIRQPLADKHVMRCRQMPRTTRLLSPMSGRCIESYGRLYAFVIGDDARSRMRAPSHFCIGSILTYPKPKTNDLFHPKMHNSFCGKRSTRRSVFHTYSRRWSWVPFV